MATSRFAFPLFLLPFFFFDRHLCSQARFSACFFRCLGFLIMVPSERVASVFKPKSMPTWGLPLGALMIGVSSTAKQANHFPEESFFRERVLTVPWICLCWTIAISPKGVTLSFLPREK